MTPAGIEPAAYRFVAQHLNHCANAVPSMILKWMKMMCLLYRIWWDQWQSGIVMVTLCVTKLSEPCLSQSIKTSTQVLFKAQGIGQCPGTSPSFYFSNTYPVYISVCRPHPAEIYLILRCQFTLLYHSNLQNMSFDIDIYFTYFPLTKWKLYNIETYIYLSN